MQKSKAQYKIEPINASRKEVVTAIDVIEQYTPKGTQTILNVETENVEKLLEGIQGEVLKLDDRPRVWAKFAAAAVSADRGGTWVIKARVQDATAIADQLLAEWERRFPQ